MSDITIQTNIDKANKIFRRLANKFEDMTEIFTAGAVYWRYGWKFNKTNQYSKPFADTIFDSKGQSIEKKWTPLSPLYRQIKGNDDILEGKTGRLRKAVSLSSGDSVLKIGKKSLTMGIQNIPYARLQHWGHSQLPTEKQKWFFRRMIGMYPGQHMWKGLYSKAVRGEHIKYTPRPYFTTSNDQIPLRFIGFFTAYINQEIDNLEDQLKKIETINSDINLPPGVM